MLNIFVMQLMKTLLLSIRDFRPQYSKLFVLCIVQTKLLHEHFSMFVYVVEIFLWNKLNDLAV